MNETIEYRGDAFEERAAWGRLNSGIKLGGAERHFSSLRPGEWTTLVHLNRLFDKLSTFTKFA
jgi:hypothetical protein